MEFFFRGILMGCGHMGQIHKKHLEARGFPIEAIDGEEACLNHLTKIYTGETDFVLIATPAYTHYKYAKMALERNLNVFVEKPLALSRSEADELAQLAEHRKRILFVGHSERYNPAFLKFLDKFVHNSKNKTLIQLNFKRQNKPSKRGHDVSTFWDIGIHDFDLLYALQQVTPTINWDTVKITFNESREATEQCRNIAAIFKTDFDDGKTFTLLGNLDEKIPEANDPIYYEHADFFRLLKMPEKKRCQEMKKQLAGALFAVSYSESLTQQAGTHISNVP